MAILLLTNKIKSLNSIETFKYYLSYYSKFLPKMKTVTVRIGEKGQITVPIEVRQMENLEKGTQVEIIDLGEGSLLINKIDKKRELLIALRILGQRLKEKGFNKNKIIKFCKEVRRDVYNAEMSH